MVGNPRLPNSAKKITCFEYRYMVQYVIRDNFNRSRDNTIDYTRNTHSTKTKQNDKSSIISRNLH